MKAGYRVIAFLLLSTSLFAADMVQTLFTPKWELKITEEEIDNYLTSGVQILQGRNSVAAILREIIAEEHRNALNEQFLRWLDDSMDISF